MKNREWVCPVCFNSTHTENPIMCGNLHREIRMVPRHKAVKMHAKMVDQFEWLFGETDPRFRGKGIR